MEILLFCLVTGVAAGIIGASKGRSGVGWFLIGFFLSLIGVLIAIGVPSLKPVAVTGPATPQPTPRGGSDFILCHSCNRPRRVDSYACPHCRATAPDPFAGQKKCYACAEWILKEAIKCKHCGEMQTAAAAPLYPAPPVTIGFMGYCPSCGKLRNSTTPYCVYCRNSEPVLTEPLKAKESQPAPPEANQSISIAQWSPGTSAATPKESGIDWRQVDHPDRNRRPNMKFAVLALILAASSALADVSAAIVAQVFVLRARSTNMRWITAATNSSRSSSLRRM